MQPIQFPDNFLFGTATAALQIEGGDTGNNWYRWAEQNHIKDGTSPLRANDHWQRFREDTELLAKLGVQTHRMGLEWSRIEPKPGEFSSEAIIRYREEITLLRQRNITPLVTLYHFSHPLWFEDMNGWENEASVECFLRYVDFVVKNLQDLVAEWVTINEPNVFLSHGYVMGIWPPGKQDSTAMLKAARHLVLAHLKAYRRIHDLRPSSSHAVPTLVGVAHHLRIFHPLCPLSPLDRLSATLNNFVFQNVFVESMGTGRFLPPLGSGYPLGKGKYQDFIGINYYSRDMIQFAWKPAELFAKRLVAKNAPTSDLGWEIYPRGLYLLGKHLHKKYQLPIYITENGTCDKTDRFRPQYIYDHLYQVSQLIQKGIPVERYYYWTFIDNFEWVEGESAPFGLVGNDYETQARHWRNSAAFYKEICTKKAVSHAMLKKYLANKAYEALP